MGDEAVSLPSCPDCGYHLPHGPAGCSARFKRAMGLKEDWTPDTAVSRSVAEARARLVAEIEHFAVRLTASRDGYLTAINDLLSAHAQEAPQEIRRAFTGEPSTKAGPSVKDAFLAGRAARQGERGWVFGNASSDDEHAFDAWLAEKFGFEQPHLAAPHQEGK